MGQSVATPAPETRSLSKLLFRLLFPLLLLAPCAMAQELRMGVQSPFVVDPHYLFLGPNMAAARHIFDSFIGRDADAHWTPSLAESCREAALQNAQIEAVDRLGVIP